MEQKIMLSKMIEFLHALEKSREDLYKTNENNFMVSDAENWLQEIFGQRGYDLNKDILTLKKKIQEYIALGVQK